MGQNSCLQHLQHTLRDRNLMGIVHVAHVVHPVGPVPARGEEKGIDIASVEADVREGAAKEVGDEVVVPVGLMEAEEADTSE